MGYLFNPYAAAYANGAAQLVSSEKFIFFFSEIQQIFLGF